MIHVLLVKPWGNTWFPIGYAYLVAAWKKAGIQVDFVDLDKDTLETLTTKLQQSSYTAICAGGMVASYNCLKHIMQLAHRESPDLPRVIGGPITTNIPLKYIFDDIGVDFAVIGEAEESSVLLLEHIAKHSTAPSPLIPGVAWASAAPEQGFLSSHKAQKPDIETLLFPDYSFWEYKWHSKQVDASIPYDLFPVLTGRGCVGNCAFCAPPAGRYRSRAPKSVIKEIESLASTRTINKIYFSDEMFFNSSEKITDFCAQYKKMGNPYTWACNMRVDGPIECLPMMREHGCTNIYFGFESVCDRVLTAMNKRTTHAMQLAALQAAKETGIHVQALWMVGNYSETEEEMCESFAFFRSLHQTAPATLITYPGTLNYTRACKAGLIQDELSYIQALEDLFLEPTFLRFTKFIHGDLPYLNVSAMSNETFFSTYFAQMALLVQSMEILDPHLVRDSDNALHVEGLCPHCKNTVQLKMPDGQPFNIHAIRCPHCNPLWLHVSPFNLPEFNSVLTDVECQTLRNKKNILIIDDNQHTAHFFMLKNYLQLDTSQIRGFVRTSGFAQNHVFYHPVFNLESIPSDVDCILVAAVTEKTRLAIQHIEGCMPKSIPIINCVTRIPAGGFM